MASSFDFGYNIGQVLTEYCNDLNFGFNINYEGEYISV